MDILAIRTSFHETVAMRTKMLFIRMLKRNSFVFSTLCQLMVHSLSLHFDANHLGTSLQMRSGTPLCCAFWDRKCKAQS
jgi:hypothetical protein